MRIPLWDINTFDCDEFIVCLLVIRRFRNHVFWRCLAFIKMCALLLVNYSRKFFSSPFLFFGGTKHVLRSQLDSFIDPIYCSCEEIGQVKIYM